MNKTYKDDNVLINNNLVKLLNTKFSLDKYVKTLGEK